MPCKFGENAGTESSYQQFQIWGLIGTNMKSMFVSMHELMNGPDINTMSHLKLAPTDRVRQQSPVCGVFSHTIVFTT